MLIAHHSIQLEDVISVHYDSHTGSNNFDGNQVRTDYYSFTLHYATCTPNSKWKLHSVTFYHEDPEEIDTWTNILQNYLLNSKFCLVQIIISVIQN